MTREVVVSGGVPLKRRTVCCASCGRLETCGGIDGEHAQFLQLPPTWWAHNGWHDSNTDEFVYCSPECVTQASDYGRGAS